MMKTYLKKEKGITIISLIITIIVMVILAGVGISAITPGGLTEKAESIKENLALKQAIEEIHNEFDYKYYLQTGKELSEDIVKKAGEKAAKAGVSGEKIAICYDKKTGENLIFYRYNLVTSDEIEKLEAENVKVLKADYNLDGMISEEDYEVLSQYVNGDIQNIKGIEIWGDIAGNDEVIDSYDQTLMAEIVNGDMSLKELYSEMEEK